ncbi:gp53-like domain-containing protein [Citrobacter portucalensis]
MYFVDNNSAVPVMPQVKPVRSATPLYFTEGGNGVPPTWPGPDWFNIFQTELLNILKEAGINPDKANHAQLLAAMKKLLLSRSNPFGDIKADGPAAIATALANLHLEETVSRAANAMQINMDGKDIRDPATFRKSLNLGDSATRNTGSGLAEVVTGSILNFVIASLELKSASRAEVGTGNSSVPNNSIVASAISAALTAYLPKRAFTDKDFIRIPDVPGGLIIQWGRSAVQIPANSSGNITLPTPFPNGGLFVLAFYSGDSGLQSTFNALVGSGSVKVFNTHPTNAATPSVLVFGY